MMTGFKVIISIFKLHQHVQHSQSLNLRGETTSESSFNKVLALSANYENSNPEKRKNDGVINRNKSKNCS